jgi:hypothetical protein
MSYRETEHLRVLIANERKDRLALVAPIVASLGHEVIARWPSAAAQAEPGPSVARRYRRGCDAHMRPKDKLRAVKLKQVARRMKDGSTKARSMSRVKRAAEAEREHRRR